MSGKSVFGSILVSILGSIIIIGLLGYFLLPTIYPNTQTNPIIIQSKYQEWNSEAYIWDDDTSDYLKMEDTEINITIQQNSQISMTFFAMSLLTLDTTFNIKNTYKVSLVIIGVSNRTFMVGYYDDSGATGFYRQLTFDLYSTHISEPLSAGTYTCAVYWRSTFDASGTNSLSVAHAPTWNYTRSLLIQEMT